MVSESLTTSKDGVISSSRYVGPYKVSESIYLTPVWEMDGEELYRVMNINDAIANGLHSKSIIFPFPLEEALSFAARHKSKRENNTDLNSWAIRQSVDGPLIGVIGIDKRSEKDHGGLGLCYRATKEPSDQSSDNTQKSIINCCSMGYWISPEHAGKGIVTEVVRYVLEYFAPKELGYGLVHAEAWVENKASQRVMEKAGMIPTQGVPCFVPKFNSMKDIAHYIKEVN